MLKCYPHPPSTRVNVMTSLAFPLCFGGRNTIVPEQVQRAKSNKITEPIRGANSQHVIEHGGILEWLESRLLEDSFFVVAVLVAACSSLQ